MKKNFQEHDFLVWGSSRWKPAALSISYMKEIVLTLCLGGSSADIPDMSHPYMLR